MALIDRGVITWSGFPGAPGYSVLYAKPGASFMACLKTFFTPFNDFLPAGVSLSFPNHGDTIESTTGDLAGSWSGSTLSGVSGGITGPYSSAVGACVTWKTSTIVAGHPGKPPHKAHGRTMLVPLASSAAFQADGTLLDTFRAFLLTAAGNLITCGGDHFVIWRRPDTGLNNGEIAVVDGFTIADKTAVLRSRRD